ncbi:uncharacterized protein BO97DRAFT_413376 [Aspergillus homomorphus CBS 101889]|uniref:Geranylgeranyl pyrophosphate synthetase n=1 Tax=Aspergillus homomorphus (strain CBS 101889) TaxID=1450537 RepID=A0A395HZL8_ASPHC|nr:hypothetical protein BO97DRAFT_413376 [Aspergillus homomorphus CBS 101889]RAL13381.1 hypothetical protein BO97DRAFT_413376 [Aspergillus homomorphus CBS 101889]
MASVVGEISRAELKDTHLKKVSITNVKHLSSYNWIEAASPTIAVPGSPALWTPPTTPKKIDKDTGLIYIAQNTARHPDSPLEPLFRSLYIENPSFRIDSVDLVTDRNNIRKLLSFVSPPLSKNRQEPWVISAELVKNTNTVIFCRWETKTSEVIGPHEYKGFGHEFGKAFTTEQVLGSTGHHRVISYQLGPLKLMVRHETDGYFGASSAKASAGSENVGVNVSSTFLPTFALGLSSLSSPEAAAVGSKLRIKKEGQAIPIQSTLEIKTRAAHRPLSIRQVIPQLWVSQTPNLVRAYHTQGVFDEAKAEDVTCEIRRWEEENQDIIKKLILLIEKIVNQVKNCGGQAVIKYDERRDRLGIWKVDRERMLPDDLYNRFHEDLSKVKDDFDSRS